MKLIVALGNPGIKYAFTRHNAGWLWLDGRFGTDDYETNKYGQYHYKKVTNTNNEELVLIKPTTFMNNSGLAVAHALDFFAIEVADLVVVHDEFDLLIGQYKYDFARGHAGHNGVRSIVDKLGSNEFYRLRLGVRPPEVSDQQKADDFVLKPFSTSDLETLLSTASNVDF